jgi:branched-subunit amino acid transport protein
MMDHGVPFVVALGVAFSASLVWRILGVLLASRIDPNGLLLRWFGCVAYAMLAALVMGYFVLPGGALGTTPVTTRMASLAAAFAAYFLCRRKMAVGVGVGLAAFLVIEAATGRIQI